MDWSQDLMRNIFVDNLCLMDSRIIVSQDKPESIVIHRLDGLTDGRHALLVLFIDLAIIFKKQFDAI
jgi:hypothetical protein